MNAGRMDAETKHRTPTSFALSHAATDQMLWIASVGADLAFFQKQATRYARYMSKVHEILVLVHHVYLVSIQSLISRSFT